MSARQRGLLILVGGVLRSILASGFVRNSLRAHHRVALVRSGASRDPSSPSAPTGNRPEGGVASTSSSSLPLSMREFRYDDRSMGLPIWYSHLIGARAMLVAAQRPE